MCKTKREELFVTRYAESLRYNDLKNGIIRVEGAIEGLCATEVSRELSFIRRNGIKHITIFINSNGGGVYDALAVYDHIREMSNSGFEITIIVDGLAASAAAQIVLQAADSRMARPSARLMVHEVRRFIFFSTERTSDLKDESEHMEELNDQVVEIMSKRCGRSAEEIKEKIHRKDTWFTAQEALGWGLIDKIYGQA